MTKNIVGEKVPRKVGRASPPPFPAMSERKPFFREAFPYIINSSFMVWAVKINGEVTLGAPHIEASRSCTENNLDFRTSHVGWVRNRPYCAPEGQNHIGRKAPRCTCTWQRYDNCRWYNVEDQIKWLQALIEFTCWRRSSCASSSPLPTSSAEL